MSKKMICSLLLCCLIGSGVFAQRFMQSAGATISVMSAGAVDGYTSITLLLNDVTYYPRFNFVENPNSSISAGIPLSVGFGTFSDPYGDASLYYIFDAPLAIDYNIGGGSTKDAGGKTGGYVGAGFGYTYTSLTEPSGIYGPDEYKAISYGPMARAGVRFRFSLDNKPTPDFGLTVGFFYKVGLEADKFKTGGLNLLFDF
jgi:hypothetical protein